MTIWEQWLSQQKNRKEIICAVYDCNGTGACGTDCLMYPFCREHNESERNYLNLCNEYLDSEAKATRETVVLNLTMMMKDAEKKGYDGYVKILTRAIELLKEDK